VGIAALDPSTTVEVRNAIWTTSMPTHVPTLSNTEQRHNDNDNDNDDNNDNNE
jgi:hypothetical protein